VQDEVLSFRRSLYGEAWLFALNFAAEPRPIPAEAAGVVVSSRPDSAAGATAELAPREAVLARLAPSPATAEPVG
jgi:hypothetical protein